MDKEDIFQTNDLFEKKDTAAVTNTIYALGRAVRVSINSRSNVSIELEKYCYIYFQKNPHTLPLPIAKRRYCKATLDKFIVLAPSAHLDCEVTHIP